MTMPPATFLSSFTPSPITLPSPATTRTTTRAAPLRAPVASAASFPLLDAAKSLPVRRTPIWLFRQAGRHLPEYRDYKAETGKNFLELLKDPKDVAEVTMQPLRRYDLDAAILFSDILVVIEALGAELDMPGGKGILVVNPLLTVSEVARRIPKAVNVQKQLGHVLSAVTEIKSQLANHRAPVPLIGFAAAPFTLFFYLLGGSSKKNTEIATTWLALHPAESRAILSLLAETVAEFLSAQIDAGADCVQLFEAMAMHVTEPHWHDLALPAMLSVASELRRRHPSVPIMGFARGAAFDTLGDLAASGGFDVLTVDLGVDRVAVRERVAGGPGRVAMQGNFDPKWLVPREGVAMGAAKEKVREEVRRMLGEFGTQGLVANLGEGLGGRENPELVACLVDAVHDESERMIQEEKLARLLSK